MGVKSTQSMVLILGAPAPHNQLLPIINNVPAPYPVGTPPSSLRRQGPIRTPSKPREQRKTNLPPGTATGAYPPYPVGTSTSRPISAALVRYRGGGGCFSRHQA